MRCRKIPLTSVPGVATILEVPHHSLTSGTGENVGMVIMELEDWSRRRAPGLDIKSIQGKAMAVGAQFPDAQVLARVPPPIQGLGDSGGVTFALQAVSGQGFRELSEAVNRLVRRIMQSGKAMYAFTSFDCSTPMVEFRLDRAKAEAMGVPVSDVFNTLQAQLGSFYVNDFNKFGKTYQVKIQAEKSGRATMASLDRIYVIGVMPLLYATGAGAGARVSVGTVTFWGMLVATVAGMLLVPPLYVCFQRISEFFMGQPRPPVEN